MISRDGRRNEFFLPMRRYFFASPACVKTRRKGVDRSRSFVGTISSDAGEVNHEHGSP
jgi:hypothetical protein